jgi:hypothetical protein
MERSFGRDVSNAQEAYEKCIRILVGKLEEKRRLGRR